MAGAEDGQGGCCPSTLAPGLLWLENPFPQLVTGVGWTEPETPKTGGVLDEGSQKCKGESMGLWLYMRVWAGCVRACVWSVCVCVCKVPKDVCVCREGACVHPCCVHGQGGFSEVLQAPCECAGHREECVCIGSATRCVWGGDVLGVCVQGAVRRTVWCVVCVCEGHCVCAGDSATWRVALGAAGARSVRARLCRKECPGSCDYLWPGHRVVMGCPQGPVPAELLTWGKRLGHPSPLSALLPTSKAVGRSPLGPAQIDKDFSLSWRWWLAPLAVR